MGDAGRPARPRSDQRTTPLCGGQPCSDSGNGPRLTCGVASGHCGEISLSAEGLNRKRYCPFSPTKMAAPLCRRPNACGTAADSKQWSYTGSAAPEEDATKWFGTGADGSKTQGERIFTELLDTSRTRRWKEQKERADYAFEAGQQAIGKSKTTCCARTSPETQQRTALWVLAALAEAAASGVPDAGDGARLRRVNPVSVRRHKV